MNLSNIAVGLALGLTVGALNQFILWWAVNRLGPQKSMAIMARFMGGCAVRLMLDALTLYLAWRLAGQPRNLMDAGGAIVGAMSGLLVATGVFTWWQYRSARKAGRAPSRRLMKEARRKR